MAKRLQNEAGAQPVGWPVFRGETGVRKAIKAAAVLAVILAGAAGAGSFASDREETVLTVQVSSAEHEAQEGYFTLGDSATVMVKPGSDLFKFLSRHRGRKVRITLTDASRPGLSELER